MINITNFGYALQTFYVEKKIFDTVGRNHPFLALLMSQRKMKVSGDFQSFSIEYSSGAGRSATFSDAQGNPEGSKGVKLALSTVEDYCIKQWSDDVLASTEGGDAAAFFNARTHEMDRALQSLSDSLAHSAFRSGSGSIGRVVSTQSSSSTTITLANPEDIWYFFIGQKIVADSADGGGTVGTTVSYVKSILDRSAGTFEVAASDGGVAITATTADLAANQYIFNLGDYSKKVKGVAAWIPTTVASNDSFFGVNRSVDRERLAGWYLDYTGVAIEEALQKALKQVCMASQARPDHIFVNPTDWLALNINLGSKVQFIDPSGTANFGWQGFTITGPRGPVKVMMDADVPDGEAVIIQLDTWHLMHKDKAPIFLQNRDGLTVSRVHNADAYEARMKFNGQIACSAPFYNARVKLR
jgi:hypothetical protein